MAHAINNNLTTAEKKVEALIAFINEYYYCDCPLTFGIRLFEVIEDIAFCQDKSQWFTLRIIKEVDNFREHYGYETMSQWCEYAKHLPTPFLSKEEAEYFLRDHKLSIFRNLLLQSARTIHKRFYQIAKSEIEDIIPKNLVDSLSIEKIYEITPLIDNIMHNQSSSMLEKEGIASWDKWDAKAEQGKVVGINDEQRAS